MKIQRLLLAGVLFGAQPVIESIADEDTNTVALIRQLQKRIDDLEQKVKNLEATKPGPGVAADAKDKSRLDEMDQKMRILERNKEVDAEVAAERAKQTTTASLGANGLMVRSADSNFVMNVHGYVQADARYYLGDHSLANDTLLLRRVRPVIEGSLFNKFDYRLMPDFGSGNVSGSPAGNVAVLDDAYVNARLWPQLQLQVGKYKSPVGLERLQSTAELLFIETGYATQLTPNYDLGVEVHNSLFNTPINYAIGVFNGASDAGSDDFDTSDKGKDVAGRVFIQPFLTSDNQALNKLGFGVGGSFGHHDGPLATYKTPGQQTIFTYTNTASAGGQQYRVDPQFYYYWGPFGILGEYVLSSQEVKSSLTKTSARFNNTAWQIEASYFLTGDENSFRSTSRTPFQPRHPFGLGGGGWGAFELVARVGRLSLDKDAFPKYATTSSAREATSWGAGVNWYLNSNVRLYLDYELTQFEGGSKAAGSTTANHEHALLARVQFSF
jgi:phosphate-selective porin OprO and OprP